MNKQRTIAFSAPGKIHLLGEHVVVYGKPALLTTIDLRVIVSISPSRKPILDNNLGLDLESIKEIIEETIKRKFKINKVPGYNLTIQSKLPLGSGLGSSAAISSAYIAALLTHLKVKWDLNLVNELTFEAEKIFHGNPSGADNSTVIFGGLIWFRKETPNLKLIHKLPFSIPQKLAQNFVLINTGTPKETTKEMVGMVSSKLKNKNSKLKKIFDSQEQLTKELLLALQQANEKELIRIIRQGEKNLEELGVVSKSTQKIIRKIEKVGGAAKICGGGGKDGPTGVLLCYHPTPSKVIKIAKLFSLDYFKTSLGVEGLRHE